MAALTASDSGNTGLGEDKEFTKASKSVCLELVSDLADVLDFEPNMAEGGRVFNRSLSITIKLATANPAPVRMYILSGQFLTLPVWRFGPWLNASVIINSCLTPCDFKVEATAFMNGGGPQMKNTGFTIVSLFENWAKSSGEILPWAV